MGRVCLTGVISLIVIISLVIVKSLIVMMYLIILISVRLAEWVLKKATAQIISNVQNPVPPDNPRAVKE